MTSRLLSVMAAVGLCLLPGAASAQAQYQQTRATFVPLGNGVPGVLYEPLEPSAKSQIGVFVMHAAGDYLNFSACTELSKRGYRVLCANNSANRAGFGNEGGIDRMVLDVKLGVAYLRQYPGVRKVVLFGHSGGGGLMSTYQNIAENGLKACQGPEKIARCPDSLAGLPPADGLMLVDANFGDPAMMLFSLDPAIGPGDGARTRRPELDLFNPENGFTQEGATYSAEFVRRFQMQAGRRNNQLIRAALDRLDKINAQQGDYNDDEPFIVPGANSGGMNNKLYAQDVRLLSHTRRAWPLVHADGTVTTQVVHSVRAPANMESLTPSLERGALKTTVRRFLNTYAVRVTDDFGFDEDSIRGIDWSSSYTCPPGNVAGVTVPLLAMGMTAGWEYLAAELIYDNAKSTDKAIAFVDGATHIYTTCAKCEKTPGQFGNTVKTTYDYIDGWLGKPGRF